MKTCTCGTVYPGFLTRCLHCGKNLGPSAKAKVLDALAQYHSALKLRDPSDPYGFMIRELAPPPEQIERNLRDYYRRQCQLFYDRYASNIEGQYSREQLAGYLEAHMGDDCSPRGIEARATELISLLHQLGDLGAEYRARTAARKAARTRAAEQTQPDSVPQDELAQEILSLQRAGYSPQEIANHVAAMLARKGQSLPPATPSIFRLPPQ